MALTDDVLSALRKPSWERRVRNGRTTYVPHRFPIKDGLTAPQVMALQAMKQNALLEKLLGK